MRKLILLALAALMVISLSACKGKNLEGSLEDILKKIYDTAKVTDQFKSFLKDGVQTVKITKENSAYYLGKEGLEFEEGIASQPIMSTSAYELDLVRVKKGADVEKMKSEIRQNVNPMKWVCVGVKPENVIVDSIGDVIIIIMSNNQGKELHDAFVALKK